MVCLLCLQLCSVCLQVTVPALLATKAGRVVRRLRGRQGEVGRLATIIVTNWKHLVLEYEEQEEVAEKEVEVRRERRVDKRPGSLLKMDDFLKRKVKKLAANAKDTTEKLEDVEEMETDADERETEDEERETFLDSVTQSSTLTSICRAHYVAPPFTGGTN